MLNADMNSLFNDSSIDQLVDTDPDGCLGYVKDNTGTSVVELVWHTSVDRGVGKNVHVITHLDALQVLGHVGKTALAELLGKHVARTRSDSEGMRHGD